MPNLFPDDSIYKTIKKLMQVPEEYNVFDFDLAIHINTAFSNLFQLGVGPTDHAFAITSDEDKWSDFLPDSPNFELVKTYIYLKVRLTFDPPSTSFGIEAVKEQIRELEWRMEIFDSPVFNDITLG